jgi:hypothetical protein
MTDEEMREYVKAVMEDRAPPLTDVSLKTLNTIGNLMKKAHIMPSPPHTIGNLMKKAHIMPSPPATEKQHG